MLSICTPAVPKRAAAAPGVQRSSGHDHALLPRARCYRVVVLADKVETSPFILNSPDARRHTRARLRRERRRAGGVWDDRRTCETERT